MAGAAFAQTTTAWAPFYAEVPKDGRIYVFAIGQRYDAFEKSGGAEIGVGHHAARATARTARRSSSTTRTRSTSTTSSTSSPGEYFAPPKVTPPSPYPAGKFSGLMFGDFYAYDKWHQNHDQRHQHQQRPGPAGLLVPPHLLHVRPDVQREAHDALPARGEQQRPVHDPGNITPFVKDAYLKWTFWNKQVLTVGIQPTLTFDWYEGFWGLRHIEKTPEDLYRIDSSRDFGVTVGGPILAVKNLNYGVQYGNESGNGSEIDKYKTWRLEARYDANPGIAVEGYYGHHDRAARPGPRHVARRRGLPQQVAARCVFVPLPEAQVRQAPNVPDQEIDIWSAWGYWEFSPKKCDVFFRYDDVKGKLGSADTGLPGADGIDYWIMSTKQPFKNYIFGGEWWIHPSVRFSPNVEMVKYDNDPDPTNFPGRDKDTIYRVTFFWTW